VIDASAQMVAGGNMRLSGHGSQRRRGAKGSFEERLAARGVPAS
jgi:hypothetical protein